MAVALTTKAPQYFLTKFENGRQPLVSTVELAGLYNKNNPKYLGKVLAEDIDQGSIFAELMAKGNEFTVGAEQIIWNEEGDVMSAAVVKGKGAVTRATNDFTINAAAIPADPDDVDSARPKNPEWVQVNVGLQFVAFDSTGKKDNGTITAISSDRRTFTAVPTGGAWTIGTSDIDIYFTGNNLDHCELAPCVGYRVYSPARENSFFKDSVCETYCEETEIANGTDGGDAYTLFPSPDGVMMVDERLTDKQKLLTARSEYAFAFEKRKSLAEAGSEPRGTNGVITIAERRATKFQGMIETLADVKNLASYLRSMGVKKATMRCTNLQFTKLIDLVQPTSPYYFSPFQDNSNELFSIGFSGFKIGDVTIIFKQWSALDMQGDNVQTRYHYLIIPEGTLRRKINGRTQTVGYLNIAWFGNTSEVYKYLRKEDPVMADGRHTVHYVNKFAPVAFMVDKWILGCTIS